MQSHRLAVALVSLFAGAACTADVGSLALSDRANGPESLGALVTPRELLDAVIDVDDRTDVGEYLGINHVRLRPTRGSPTEADASRETVTFDGSAPYAEVSIDDLERFAELQIDMPGAVPAVFIRRGDRYESLEVYRRTDGSYVFRLAYFGVHEVRRVDLLVTTVEVARDVERSSDWFVARDRREVAPPRGQVLVISARVVDVQDLAPGTPWSYSVTFTGPPSDPEYTSRAIDATPFADDDACTSVPLEGRYVVSHGTGVVRSITLRLRTEGGPDTSAACPRVIIEGGRADREVEVRAEETEPGVKECIYDRQSRTPFRSNHFAVIASRRTSISDVILRMTTVGELASQLGTHFLLPPPTPR